eukprot:6474025-Amphidinium_carterae.2
MYNAMKKGNASMQDSAGGYYVTPPGPHHQRYKERLAKLEEDERQREAEAKEEARHLEITEERDRLNAYVQRLEAEASVPQEVIAQVQDVQVEVPEIPAIGSTSGQTSWRSSNTRRLQQGEDDDEEYWKNIYDVMCNNWLDERGLTTAN